MGAQSQMSVPRELASDMAQALRSTPCRCGWNTIDRPMDQRKWITCGRCVTLKRYGEYLGSEARKAPAETV